MCYVSTIRMCCEPYVRVLCVLRERFRVAVKRVNVCIIRTGCTISLSNVSTGYIVYDTCTLRIASCSLSIMFTTGVATVV